MLQNDGQGSAQLHICALYSINGSLSRATPHGRRTMDLAVARNEMVDQQIAGRGVRDQLVLDAMRSVPREKFLPDELREFAYRDSPLAIAAGQTISQPFMVALMIEALELKGGEKVLEIGTGSGYAAAILGQIAGQVYTMERIELLAKDAAKTLAEEYLNVQVYCGDGSRGLAEQAPFDAIVVAASGPKIPESLRNQLKIGGRLVVPVGPSESGQKLVRVTRTSDTKFTIEAIANVNFVPLIGDEAWNVYDDDVAI